MATMHYRNTGSVVIQWRHWRAGVVAGAVLCWGRRQLTHKPRPYPQMWHGTMLDELKASAYRWKRAFCGLQKFKIHQNGFPPGAGAHEAPQTPYSAGEGTPSRYPILLVSSILPPTRLFGEGIARKYFSGTCPEWLVIGRWQWSSASYCFRHWENK